MNAYRDMGVSGVALGIGDGEDSVDQHERPDDLGTKASAVAVSGGELIGAAAVPVVVGILESFHQPNAAYGPQALDHHVHHRPYQRHLPRQEHPERHRWVYVAPCPTISQILWEKTT